MFLLSILIRIRSLYNCYSRSSAPSRFLRRSPQYFSIFIDRFALRDLDSVDIPMEASSGTVAHVEQINIDIDGPAPVPADYHFHHGYHHQDPDIQVQKGRESPKPNTFTSGISMAELTAAQRSELRGHTLHRKGSKHLDHYFVGHSR